MPHSKIQITSVIFKRNNLYIKNTGGYQSKMLSTISGLTITKWNKFVLKSAQHKNQPTKSETQLQHTSAKLTVNMKQLTNLFSLIPHGGAGGLAVRRWICDHLSHGFESHYGPLRNNLGQVVHTYAPLSPSRITWYRSKDGDSLPLRGWLKKLPGGWLPVHWDQLQGQC